MLQIFGGRGGILSDIDELLQVEEQQYEKELSAFNICWIVFGQLLANCGIAHVSGISHILEGNRNCPATD
jgi:hypothetical protein